jgi:23S rRNA (guanosine2251-2'-O)-methyltransferase
MNNLIIGRNAIQEAMAAGTEIEKIYLLHSIHGEFEVEIRNYCRQHNIPLAKVPEVKLKELSRNRNHQGVVGIISGITFCDYRKIIANLLEEDKEPLIVITESITDVRNVGAIARSAHYFGANLIIMAGNASARINEDTIKASAGAILTIPVARAGSLLALISELQQLHIRVIATSLNRASDVQDTDLSGPVAFILGNEEKGLHYKVLEIVDETIKIPQVSGFDSLNVSVAAGIVLYEASRQKRIKTTNN